MSEMTMKRRNFFLALVGAGGAGAVATSAGAAAGCSAGPQYDDRDLERALATVREWPTFEFDTCGGRGFLSVAALDKWSNVLGVQHVSMTDPGHDGTNRRQFVPLFLFPCPDGGHYRVESSADGPYLSGRAVVCDCGECPYCIYS